MSRRKGRPGLAEDISYLPLGAAQLLVEVWAGHLTTLAELARCTLASGCRPDRRCEPGARREGSRRRRRASARTQP